MRPVAGVSNVVVASVLHSVGTGVVVVVTSLVVLPPPVAVLHPQVEARVAADQDGEDGEGGGHLVELQPVVHLVVVVDRTGREVRHHMELGRPFLVNCSHHWTLDTGQ